MILMHEEMALSPREFPTIATLIVTDRRFSGGDENFDRISELAGYLKQNRKGISWARRHGLWHEIWRDSQNRLRLDAPEDQAGWTCLGAIYIDPDKAKSELRKGIIANLRHETLEAQIQRELDDFSGWLRGDTWLVMNESGDDIYFGTKAECQRFIEEELLAEPQLVTEA